MTGFCHPAGSWLPPLPPYVRGASKRNQRCRGSLTFLCFFFLNNYSFAGTFSKLALSVQRHTGPLWWHSSSACMLTVLWEVCGSGRVNVHAVEDFHVLDVCGRTQWSGGNVGPWTLWNTEMNYCYRFQCKFVNMSSRKGSKRPRCVNHDWLLGSKVFNVQENPHA